MDVETIINLACLSIISPGLKSQCHRICLFISIFTQTKITLTSINLRGGSSTDKLLTKCDADVNKTGQHDRSQNGTAADGSDTFFSIS